MSSLFDTLERFGQQTAVHAGRDYSYVDMLTHADAIGRAVGGRTLVFCLCDNTSESLFGYIGFLRGQVVPVLLDASISHEHLTRLLQLYRPTHVWAHAERSDLQDGFETTHVYGSYRLAAAETAIEHDLHDELALLLTTSGSTGSQKLVRLTYDNLLENARSIATYLEITGADRPITTLPMNYSYGLSIINSHFLCGATLILTSHSMVQPAFWELCRTQRATTFGGVPFHYEMLVKLNIDLADYPDLITLTQAGGKLDETLATRVATMCAAHGVRFVMMYGQTEATARMTYLPSEYALEKMGSIGQPIPGGRLTLRAENGDDITEPFVTGELMYHGKNVSFGYATSPHDLANGDDHNGTLATGDLAYVDLDGYYYVVGRTKRIVKLHGSRISLDEVETLLRRAGHDCVCAGSDDALTVYTLHDDHTAIQRTLRDMLRVRKARVLRLDAFPRNAYGKILYAALPTEDVVLT